MSTDLHTPAATVERVSELLCEGRIDALLDLYEDDAAFMPEPGRAVVGTASIRAELERFAALQPRMTGSIENVIETRDTALVANRWQLEGTAPDGSPVDMAGMSTDVLRRRPDGSWGVLIDNPWGAGAAA
jgi:ketosteroid isomerase-like protein